LLSYYRGLRTTPAISATLAELAFPLSAIVLNAIFLERVPDGSQWLGVVFLAGTIVVMGVAAATRKPDATGVQVTDRTLTPELV